MTPAELSALRQELRLSQAALARVLGVDRGTIIRWEQGRTRIPAMLDLAAVAIRQHRAGLQSRGLGYPMVADVTGVMSEEGVDQATAIRLFGVEP